MVLNLLVKLKVSQSLKSVKMFLTNVLSEKNINKKQLFKQIIVVFLAFFSTLTYAQDDDNSENATIYIGREGRTAGGALLSLHPYTLAAKSVMTGPNNYTNYFVADNSKIIGTVSRGDFIEYTCAPGERVFSAFIPPITSDNPKKSEKSVGSIKIDVKAGATYYLRTNVDKGLFLINLSNDKKELEKFKKKVNKKKPEKIKPKKLEKPQIEYQGILTARVDRLLSGNTQIANSSSSNSSSSFVGASMVASIASTSNAQNTQNATTDYNTMSLEDLETAKQDAIENEDYTLASAIKDHIATKEIPVSELEKQKQVAIIAEDYDKAAELKLAIEEREVLASVNNPSIESNLEAAPIAENKRALAFADLLVNRPKEHVASSKQNVIASNTFSKSKRGAKKAASDSTNTAVYRRSSLYTLMVNNPVRQHATTIMNTFGNEDIPEKFNDHNVGPYLIDTEEEAKDKTYIINDFLSNNNIAKELVCKWFNRSEKGGFNMNLISERGSYNASDLDVRIAKNNERGMAILADAGEELIKNTFVVVNDYKYTNKEEVAKKASKWLDIASTVSSAAGFDVVSTVASATSLASSVAGKGYVIKSTTYLYKLVWNNEIAATFYNDYWTTDDEFDSNKKDAFENSNLFQLELVGTESAFADLQSSIFTSKSDTDLISIATIKSTEKAIAKLQRKYEVFRTKTPLISGEPIAAKIGMKEGVEKGDKFEVLEQVLTNEGKTEYKRVGIVKVDKSNIWDNRFKTEEEIAESIKSDEYTLFKGGKGYYSGMLIRQIN